MKHETFNYTTMDAIGRKADGMGAFIPLEENTGALFEPLMIGGHQVPNRILFQPMEGCDSADDGAPGPLTQRRYERFAKAGPGIIWFEAVATLPEARASAHQLTITAQSLPVYQRLTDRMREICLKENGYAPLIIMQATNSGRYARPDGQPAPLAAYRCPPLEDSPMPDERIVDDDQLRHYEAAFGPVARLAQQAGFDGLDVKACHRYLASELLSAYLRPGDYGGDYDNRTRFLKNAFRAAQASVSGDFFLTSRLNAYDGFPYPYGFGMAPEGLEADLSEPIRLIGELQAEFQLPLINITMGNPYRNPHVNRPYDKGNYVPPEHPLEGLNRMMRGLSAIQRALPTLPLAGSAFSYLRQYAVNLAAGMVSGGHCALAGFGRLTLAYPDFVQDLRRTHAIDRQQVCVTCGGCAALLRAGRPAGCIIRDREVYQA